MVERWNGITSADPPGPLPAASCANDVLDNLILLLALWKAHPEQVQESDVRRLASGIETVRLGPGNTLVTYGELNAPLDYLADAAAIDTVEPTVIVPILEEIRQQTYNQLKKLRTGTDPLETSPGQRARRYQTGT